MCRSDEIFKMTRMIVSPYIKNKPSILADFMGSLHLKGEKMNTRDILVNTNHTLAAQTQIHLLLFKISVATF